MPERFDYWGKFVKNTDPDVYDSIQREMARQEDGLELIASENYASKAVIEATGSLLTNKYAEGYPAKRYYGGCEWVDEVESFAIQRACKLFGCEAANVQPHSGSNANMATYMALAEHGDTFLGMDLSQGGHLTHGSPVNFSGKMFNVKSYGLHPKKHRIDYDFVRDLAKKEKPRVIIAGASAYPRIIDFKIFGEIANEVGADLVVDMAHIAGLVAADLHPSPIPHARVSTTTTHKTLRGPRGGLILCKEEDLKKINSKIFPGIQGGPLMHVIAAKAICFKEALSESFIDYQKQVLKNMKALADRLMESGFTLVTGGTDNHLILLDLSGYGDGSTTGKESERWLDSAGITVNKNTVPNEKRSPFVTSGLRIGSPAVTTRGFQENEMTQIADWIKEIIDAKGDSGTCGKVKSKVKDLCSQFPIYQGS